MVPRLDQRGRVAPPDSRPQQTSHQEFLLQSLRQRPAHLDAEDALHQPKPGRGRHKPRLGLLGLRLHWYSPDVAALITALVEAGALPSLRGPDLAPASSPPAPGPVTT